METEQNGKPKGETDLQTLIRITTSGFERMETQFVGVNQRIDDVEAGLNNRILGVERGLNGLKYKVDQLELKVDQHRQETKDGFAALHPIIGSLSHTVVDHEQRLKELEGE